MAPEASLFRYHSRGFLGIGVAFQTRKCLHPHAVHTLVLVTVLARIFIRFEAVKTSSMTYLALDVKHKDMFCMAVRLSQCERALLHVAEMTCLALKPRFLSSVSLRKLTLALDNIGHEELVLLYQTEMVAFLADYVPVFPPLPFLKRLLHYVAGHTELRVFLGVAVILVANYNAKNRYDSNQCKNKALQVLHYLCEQPCELVMETSIHVSRPKPC